MYKEEDYLMLSGIQHFAFCRRQWAIIHIEQQWEENYRTTAGALMHKRAHDENFIEKREALLIVRGLRIASQKLGLSGQCDVVEFHQSEQGISLFGYEGTWLPLPIEYKRGKPKEANEDELQLCAQAMCLEEMFLTEIAEGFLYYGESRRRHHVIFSNELRSKVKEISVEMHELFKKGHTPRARQSKQCQACSLKDLCLPKLQKVLSVREYVNQSLKEGGGV